MLEVKYDRPTTIHSQTGSRIVKTFGIAITEYSDEIGFNPINSRGDVTGSCSIIVPRDKIGELIAALLNARDGRYGAFDLDAGDFVVENGKRIEFDSPGKVHDFLREKVGHPFAEGYEPRLVNPASPL